MDSIPLLERLKEKTNAVEEQLQQVLPGKVEDGWTKIQSGNDFESISCEFWQRITEPARDLLGRGGKRWRPLFMLMRRDVRQLEARPTTDTDGRNRPQRQSDCGRY